MEFIAALQDRVTPWSDGLEPSDAELNAIEAEMPLITAEVELLDALIVLLDQPPTQIHSRRIRRAHRKVMAARRDAANMSCPVPPAVA
ncbi:DUF6284 family protein [Streptomyces sp. XY332]|uniref:DUF6284 family protein n=1 Tax=Streptomyces sp. XY332 TaxID=1415561 RepID=UPI0006B1C5A9|nr:DUF6284 family protein [Streptomyces sp. XY332]KOY59063.1 hypothetical protein ADK59_04485 [Streptomyces sp. XY332]